MSPASELALGATVAARRLLSSEQSRELQRAALDTPGGRQAAELEGRRLAVRKAIHLKLWAWPGRLAGISATYFATDFADDLAAHITGPPEELTEGNPHVIHPALEGLALSVEQPALKEMYLRLLAAAINGRPGVDVHPSFGTLIGQLDPREAQLLALVLSRGQALTIANIGYETPQDPLPHGLPMPPRITMLARNVVPTTHPETGDFVNDPETQIWLDNWVRLRFVEIDFDSSFGENSYKWVAKHPAYIGAQPPDGKKLHITNGVLRVTELGEAFSAAIDAGNALDSNDDDAPTQDGR